MIHKRTADLRMIGPSIIFLANAAITFWPPVPVLAQPVSHAGRQMTLGSLMKRHLDALGGRTAVESIQSLRITSTVKAGRNDGISIETEKLPHKQHLKFTLVNAGSENMMSAYDGKTGWVLDTEGHLSHDPDLVAGARLDLYLASHAYALGGSARGKVTLRSEREAGTGDYIVDIAASGFPPCAFYFDPQTYLITKQKDREDGSGTYYSGYKKFGGVLFPTVEKEAGTDSMDNSTYTVTKVETNIPVDDSLFEPPKVITPEQPTDRIPD